MNTAFKFLGAAILCATVVFGTVSCKENQTEKEVTEQTDSTVCTAAPGSIVYINLDEILEKYDMANELSSVVETKVQNIEAEVNRRGKKIQKQAANYQNYAAQKQQEIQEELMVMNNQIADAIKTYIEKYNEEKKFAMILTCQAGQPVLVADPSLNVTAEVIAGLNAEYVETKNQKNEE